MYREKPRRVAASYDHGIPVGDQYVVADDVVSGFADHLCEAPEHGQHLPFLATDYLP
jgi:hypothetical protein